MRGRFRRQRLPAIIAVAVLACVGLAGCQVPPAATPIAARSVFASVSCSINTTLDTYVGYLYTDVPRIHRYAISTRDALSADAKALAREQWPAPIAADVFGMRLWLEHYAAEADQVSRAAAATNPPQLSTGFRSAYQRVTTWFDLDPDSVCRQDALGRRVSDGTVRADYIGAICSTLLPLKFYYGASHVDPARVRAIAAAARDALLSAARRLADDEWPAAVRESVEIVRDNRFAYSATFDTIATSGVADENALDFYDRSDRAVFDRVEEWFGINWDLDCLP